MARPRLGGSGRAGPFAEMDRSGLRRPFDAGSIPTALLGPTNTGKTHRAIERMLQHPTGMIGLPLRLLAREVYDRISALRGEQAVALVTGEERRVPPSPRYWVCTIEAMPPDRPVSFLAVDEVQLAGDRARGHVFTDRLLHARGLRETLFLGSETIAPLLRRLLPGVAIRGQPRLSRLSHLGPRKLGALPPRSAVVAFSVARVYALAERIRQRHGGAAVVHGALSPRTRNAQVAMYQSGEVRYLVATDAIGMGLNMDVDHVAFANLEKWDGRTSRELSAAEVAQIAGRAGRFRRDGTFGALAGGPDLAPEVADAVERHAFPPLEALWWRNSDLDFSSLDALLETLRRRPPHPFLLPMRDEDDERALERLAALPEVRAAAGSPEAVRLLWEVCRVPDYPKLLAGSHVQLLLRLFQLLVEHGRLPEDWVERHVAPLDRTDGDIEALTARITQVRTWTYVAHRPGWLADPAHWQERTRAIEDRLSDALHEALTARFVDRRSLALGRAARGPDARAEALHDSTVRVAGFPVGRLAGIAFTPLPEAEGGADRAVQRAVREAVSTLLHERLERLLAAPYGDFVVDDGGAVLWEGGAVARLVPGEEAREPGVRLLRHEWLSPSAQHRLRRKMEAFARDLVADALAPLRAPEVEGLSPPGRGLLYRLDVGLGRVSAREAADVTRALSAGDRRILARLGIRLGTEHVYLASLWEPRRARLRAILLGVRRGRTELPPLPGEGETVLAAREDRAFWAELGYVTRGPRAYRLDHLERLAMALRQRARQGAFAVDAELRALLGCPEEEDGAVLGAMGYRPTGEGGGLYVPMRRRREGRPRRRGAERVAAGAGSRLPRGPRGG